MNELINEIMNDERISARMKNKKISEIWINDEVNKRRNGQKNGRKN